jgi:hypothetical protein
MRTQTPHWNGCWTLVSKPEYFILDVAGINLASEPTRSYANHFPEHLGEMLLGMKAGQSTHFGDAECCILQVELCTVDSRPQNILVRSKASCFGKQQHEMVRRHPGNLGHGHQANVGAAVRMDVVDNFSYSCLANRRVLFFAH